MGMKIAFVFAGQGSQYKGMGYDLYTTNKKFKELFDAMNDQHELYHICFEDEERLNKTSDAQWAIYAVSVAIAQCLEDAGVHKEGCIGLSLGEYSAYTMAGAMSVEDGLSITKKRGSLMQTAIEKTESGMAAILMLDAQLVEEACSESSEFGIVSVANYNAPDQIVITGETNALEKAMELCRVKGAKRTLRLQVSGGFHSGLLNPAKQALKQALQQVEWKPCTCPVYTNVTGKECDEIIESLTEQLVSPVLFRQGIETMIDDGFDTFVEIGPKATCSSFIKKIAAHKGVAVTLCNVEDAKSFNLTMQVLRGGNQ